MAPTRPRVGAIRRLLVVALLVTATAIAPAAAQEPTLPAQDRDRSDPTGDASDLQRLDVAQRQDLAALRAQGAVTVETHAGTGQVRFIGTSSDAPIDRPTGIRASDAPAVGATAFLDRYGSLFGLAEPSRELAVAAVRQADDTSTARPGSTVRLQQVHRGVPVLAGQLTVQLAPDNRVLSALGEVLPDVEVDTDPTVTVREAAATALAVVAKHQGVAPADLSATTPELVVHNPVLLGGPLGSGDALDATFLGWQTEVTSSGPAPVRQLVVTDAHRADTVLLELDRVTTARNRIVCDNANTANQDYPCPAPGNPVVRREGDPATGQADVDLAYAYAGDTYDFYDDQFGRDSLDDDGLQLVSTVRHCPSSSQCPYANAYWSGTQMVYGDGYATADDIVGHELTHGVTEFTSGLFYYYQSGAINEALSDVFGEFIDLRNGAGDDSTGSRWLIGEDLGGAPIRDMADPPAQGDPDRMRSPLYYAGSGSGVRSAPGEDSGGVHINSGVLNKAVFLLTDGGTHNGRIVTGQGIDATAAIVYEAATAMLTSGSDYADLAVALRQSCTNLLGTAGITAGTCAEVVDAVNATEMDLQPVRGATREIGGTCPAGQIPTTLFADDMENTSSGNWSTSGGASTYTTGYAHSGDVSLWRPDIDGMSDVRTRMTSPVAIPASSEASLSFAHAFEFEQFRYDGGVVEYSTNDGATWNDAGPLFVEGGYTGTIRAGALMGRQGFVDVSFGYGSSRLNVTPLAGESVRFRFRVSSDESIGDLGWLVDDVRLATCEGDPLRFVSIEPCAVYDSRDGRGNLAGPVDGGTSLRLTVATDAALPRAQGPSDCLPPPASALAVELNLVTPRTSRVGNLRVASAGRTAEGGVVNFSPAATNSSSVPVAVNVQGQVDVFVNSAGDNATQVRVIALGYYTRSDGTVTADELLTVPTPACAVFDSRNQGGMFVGGEARTYQVAGSFNPTSQGGAVCTPPPAGAKAVLLNLVAVSPAQSGNLLAVAAGGQADGGVVNFTLGTGNNSNAVPVGVAPGGAITVTANAGSIGQPAVHVRGVVLGYLVDDSHPDADQGLAMVPATACAVFDTRNGSGTTGTRTNHDQLMRLVVASGGTLPSAQGAAICDPPPTEATAVMMNLVAIDPTTTGNLQVAPAGTVPVGGVVNFDPARGNNSNAVVSSLFDDRVDVITKANADNAVHVRGVVLAYYLPD